MQVNKMGGQALDEAASSPPILCLILVVRRLHVMPPEHFDNGFHFSHYAFMVDLSACKAVPGCPAIYPWFFECPNDVAGHAV